MKNSRNLGEAYSSPYGRVHIPWVPIHHSEKHYPYVPINSVSVGHVVVRVKSSSHPADESSIEKQKDE